MISNFHTHTVMCDGKSTPEEVVRSAIEKGFDAIGFSGHGFTDFDDTYCMQDTDGYISQLKVLRERYKKDIEIYIGVEEDAGHPVDRSKFDYILGSSHYFCVNGQYYSVDHSPETFQKCLEVFDYDVLVMAENYYSHFCSYILSRKPDIVGHFDLITKFDELGESRFLQNPAYNKLAEGYVAEAAKSGCIFEVNTGAICRGMRTTVYPSENLLYVLKKSGTRLILSSDSHAASTLDFYFDEAKAYLRDMGFRELYTLRNGEFVPYAI